MRFARNPPRRLVDMGFCMFVSVKTRACALGALVLAFSHKGIAGAFLAFWKRRASRPQSRACARRTLILAFSHKGRRDPLTAICTWFRMADSVRLSPRPLGSCVAGTTKSQTYPCKPIKGEGIR